MRSFALFSLVISTMVGSPADGRIRLEEKNYLPGVLHHLNRAQEAASQEQWELASAHTQILLHQNGLRVYIDSSSVPATTQAAARSASLKALEYWNEVIGPNSLVLVDRPEQAELLIQFNREVVLRGVQVGGYCSQSRSLTVGGDGSATPEYRATIYARYQMPNGNLLREDALHNVVAHEIGHVYGLTDCTDADHLMSPLNPNRTKFELHPDELEALRNLRWTLFTLQRSIAVKKPR